MSNTPISYPSQLGIPQCISEQVIYNATTVPVAGGGKWQRIKGTAVTGELTGQCYKTEQELPSTVNYIKHGQLLQAMLVSVTDVAEVAGRAVVQYRYHIDELSMVLPRPGALFALYVPRWQTSEERTSVKDYASTHDLSINGNVTWSDDGSLTFDSTTRGNYLISDTFTYNPRNDFTIIADRTINPNAENTSLGLRLVNTLNNEYATDAMSVRRSSNEITCEVGGHDNRINMTDVPQDGCAWLTRQSYCGAAEMQEGSRRAWRRIDINAYHIYNANYRRPMWSELRALAIWTEQLTAYEIEQAELYLTYATRPADL